MSEHLKSFLVGGIGGILPKSLTLAILLTNSPTAQMGDKIVLSFYVGIALFFVIGGVISVFAVERNRKLVDYLFAGIAAPSLIVSIGSGMSESNQQSFANIWLNSATASEQSAPEQENKTYNYVITSTPQGDQDWRKSTLSYDIIITDTQGQQSTLAISWPNPTKTIHSDAPIAKIEMQDDNGKAINSLTIDQPVSGELIVQPAVESQLDIMWMLGAKGKAKVVNCEMSFVPDKS
ncbi:hypothetical protein SAMN04488136_15017 [Vibrio xiamenensis]|uniref:Uncharacterized protein n=1 Tax=Vibrio xiamenensis TaxID=861298 RepID=A0A1G8HFH9_9VIBR|nr:hypothetical protein [Vibrio xiamenensis]SDI05281.1 hypothetical protein SAMN04488136_15017 [Vibrio xiamenensis]